MKPTLTAIASCLLLTACSFNTVNNYSTVTSVEPRAVVVDTLQPPPIKQLSSQAAAEKPPVAKTAPPPPVQQKVVKLHYKCTGVVFAKLPKAPPPPTEAIEKIDPTNKTEINKVLLHYIEELAAHLTQVKKNYASARENFKVKCSG